MLRLGMLLIDSTDAVAIFHSEHVLLLSKRQIFDFKKVCIGNFFKKSCKWNSIIV
jgi:hypothetical protein